MVNLLRLATYILLLDNVSFVHCQLLLEGYSGKQPIVLNENGTMVEGWVNEFCKDITRIGPGQGRTVEDFPLDAEEKNCILQCKYQTHGIFLQDYGVRPRHLKALTLRYYYYDFTNATEPIVNVIVDRFRRCKLDADIREHWYKMADSLPSECHYFRLLNNCLYVSGSG